MIKKLTLSEISKLIRASLKEVIWIAPSLTNEIVEILINNSSRISIKVVVDIDPKRFRQFEGEFESIVKLQKCEKIELKVATAFGFGLIKIDNNSYAYFNPLRAFEKDGDRYNAINIDETISKEVIEKFFPIEQSLFEEDAIKDLKPRSLELGELEEVKKDLEKNPPQKINIERIINTYRAKFQIVETKFSGFNIHVKKVKLPKYVLPFKDAELRKNIDSQLRLFDGIKDKEYFKEFEKIKDDFTELKSKYLVHIKTREKSIIKKIDKRDFEIEFERIISKIDKAKDDFLNCLESDIINTKERIIEELKEFTLANPDDYLKKLDSETLLKATSQRANSILLEMNIPSAEKLVGSIKLEKFYYDLTWEDLNNNQVLEEFGKKGLLDNEDHDSLMDLRKAAELE